uniref:spore cortex biosynthesis protein YabQ n=1 Tax=Clostridium sp. NkU-1 TaxID=1095009 RepID=UPI0006CFBE49
MSVHIIYEVKLLLYSFLTGAGLMITYDLLRIFRIFIPHSYVFIGIEDMIYWVYAALVTFSLLYEQNDGGLRGYAVTGVFVGMFLYDRIVSRHFIKLLKHFRRYLKIKAESCNQKRKRH